MAFKKDVLEKLGSIESKMVEQSIQLAINTKILDEHHKRSTNLEERFMPLEQSHVFFNKLSKAIIAILALCASLATIYHYFLSK